jgi:hypothetical protein
MRNGSRKTLDFYDFDVNAGHLCWTNFVQFGRNSIHGWVFCTPIWVKFDQLWKNFGVSSVKIGGGNHNGRFPPFLTNFSQFGGRNNYFKF